MVDESTNTKFVEFDILLRTFEPSAYLENFLIDISYNTSQFGSNVVANNSLELFLDPAFNVATYGDLAARDDPGFPDRFGLSITANVTSINRTLLTSSFRRIVTVRLQVTNPNTNEDFAEFSFIEAVPRAFDLSAFTSTASGDNFELFSNLFYINNGISSQIVGFPVIQNIDPPASAAGVGEVITITGYNFGETRGNSLAGKVLMCNAETGRVDAPTLTIKDFDIISWSQNEIQMRVPAAVYGFVNNSLSTIEAVGSGNFQVENLAGLKNQRFDFEVLYS